MYINISQHSPTGVAKFSNEDVFLHYSQYCEFYKVSESKQALENFLRRELFNIHELCDSFTDVEQLLDLTFKLADEQKIDTSIPFLLIEDVVEIASFDFLNQLLPYLDRKASDWCSKLSSKKGNGLILLRTVNLMRRRIIRSEHSKLAGLALLLLSKIFPVNERSGLNLKGERNIENCNLKLLTEQSNYAEEQFWRLHVLMYSPLHSVNDLFKPIQKSVDYIFSLFENIVANENQGAFRDERPSADLDFFTPQFLIEDENFSRQVSDNGFRLSVLTQILVALQDLSIRSSTEFSKSSKPELILDDLQLEWLNDSTKKAFLLISQHLNGRDHFRFLRHVIRSEKQWIKWKFLSCPEFDNCPSSHEFTSKEQQPISPAAFVDVGNEELKRLWRYDSSSVTNRQLRPEVSDYTDRYLDEDVDESSLSTNIKWRLERLKWKARF